MSLSRARAQSSQRLPHHTWTIANKALKKAHVCILNIPNGTGYKTTQRFFKENLRIDLGPLSKKPKKIKMELIKVLLLSHLFAITAANLPKEKPHFKIVRGSPVKNISEAPYVALIGVYKNDGIGICTGSIIREDAILTAAHCTRDVNYFVIQAGTVHRIGIEGTLRVTFSAFVKHPDYELPHKGVVPAVMEQFYYLYVLQVRSFVRVFSKN